MIPNHHPAIRALFDDGHTVPVVAWNSSGDALVVDRSTGKLRRAMDFASFAGIDDQQPDADGGER